MYYNIVIVLSLLSIHYTYGDIVLFCIPYQHTHTHIFVKCKLLYIWINKQKYETRINYPQAIIFKSQSYKVYMKYLCGGNCRVATFDLYTMYMEYLSFVSIYYIFWKILFLRKINKILIKNNLIRVLVLVGREVEHNH